MRVDDVRETVEIFAKNDVPLADMRMEITRTQALELFVDLNISGLAPDSLHAEYKARIAHPGNTVEDAVASLMNGTTLSGVLITVAE